jgi:hypothetical protein
MPRKFLPCIVLVVLDRRERSDAPLAAHRMNRVQRLGVYFTSSIETTKVPIVLCFEHS